MKVFRKIVKAGRLIYKRPKGFCNYCLGLFSALIKSNYCLGLPVHITIEPTNICNLHCPVCETGTGMLGRPSGTMKYEDFKAIIDKIYQHVNSISFYHMGEPFLNNDSYRMIEYGKEKGLYITSCTNGHFIDAAQLVNCGIDEISFQIGGITEETHRQYRLGSNLEEIKRNIKCVLRERAALEKKRPTILLRLIVMKHNEHEIDEFYKLARTLGVDKADVLNPCVRTWKQGDEFLPQDEKYWIYDRDAFTRGELRPKRPSGNRCNWIYISMVILNNGDIVPCCMDSHGDFVMGNILKDNLREIWNSRKYRTLRKSIVSRRDNVSICRLCSGFKIPGLYEKQVQ